MVESLIKGKDGEVRGATVRLIVKGKPKLLNRPVQKLYPLEIQIGTEGKDRLGSVETEPLKRRRNPTRAAAQHAREKIKNLAADDVDSC